MLIGYDKNDWLVMTPTGKKKFTSPKKAHEYCLSHEISESETKEGMIAINYHTLTVRVPNGNIIQCNSVTEAYLTAMEFMGFSEWNEDIY